MAAVSAEVDRRPSPALHEQDRLLAPFHGFPQQLAQPARKKGAPLLSGLGRLAAQVDELDRWQLTSGHTPGQLKPLGEASLDQGGCFHRRGRRAQEDRDLEVACGHQREVASVVARCFLLLVGGVVLLVDDDQPEVLERCEEGGTGADNDPRLSGPDPLPFAPPFAVRERRVQDSGLRSEATLDRSRGRRSEADLGHQDETAAAPGQHLLETP